MKNSGIIRYLKKLEKKEFPKEKNSDNGISFFLSLIAIAISGVSFYYQFFYESYDIKVNFISADFDDNSNLNFKMVYHNKSTLNATILRNTVVFYQDSTKIDSKSIFFYKDKFKQSFVEEFDPIVLDRDKQIYREISQPINFNNIYSKNIINLKDTIRISLAIGFLDEFGNYATSYIPMGWVTLDSLNNPESYSFTYLSKTLYVDTYRSGNSKTVEHKTIIEYK
ncbi:hypothetical protein [Flavobacterium ovatum]|uniref:hypothetical protein n=1 Tax=Flavobacterium ovatum TaxID=1928857 RepID=UPI00344B53AF